MELVNLHLYLQWVLHLVLSSENEWSYTSTPRYTLMALCSVKKKAQEQLYLYLICNGSI